MVSYIEKYKRSLKKKLQCNRSTKSKLLHQFSNSLSAYSEDHPNHTETDLIEAFGPPDEVARLLMENVSVDEITKYRRKQVLQRILTILIVAAFLCQLIYLAFFTPYTITTKSELIIEGTETNTTEVIP